MDKRFMRSLDAYRTNNKDFDFAPSKKRAVGILAIGLILFIVLMITVFTVPKVKPFQFALLTLIFPTIIVLLFIAFFLMARATNKRYWLTRDAIRILSLSPLKGEKEIYLPLSEIAGIQLSGLSLRSGLLTRLLTGGMVNHLTIELLNGKRYYLNDVPNGIAVTKVLLDKVSAVRGVPGPKLVGLSHERKALEEKLREQKNKKGR